MMSSGLPSPTVTPRWSVIRLAVPSPFAISSGILPIRGLPGAAPHERDGAGDRGAVPWGQPGDRAGAGLGKQIGKAEIGCVRRAATRERAQKRDARYSAEHAAAAHVWRTTARARSTTEHHRDAPHQLFTIKPHATRAPELPVGCVV